MDASNGTTSPGLREVSDSSNSKDSWSVVILAGGYGTRLARDIRADTSREYDSLLSLPKALLPLAGVPLIDYWVNDIRKANHIDFKHIFVVTNNTFYSQFTSWALTRGIPCANIVNDGTSSNDTRIGASCDIALCLQTHIGTITAAGSSGILVIAGDTLFYDDFCVDSFLHSLPDSATGGVLCYRVKDDSEVRKRGIIEVNEENRLVTRLLEKPDPSETDSRMACPAVYAYRANCFNYIAAFAQAAQSLPLEDHDAPGKLLGHLIACSGVRMAAHEICGRFDIGGLSEYKVTQQHFSGVMNRHLSTLPDTVTDRCFARVGLMGNPSDGFHGKTLSFLIENFYAEVHMEATLNHSSAVEIVPHPICDQSAFGSLSDLQHQTSVKGYYGGLRLLNATCKIFSSLCFRAGISVQTVRGFKMTYDTNIPRMVGLSGSSAIIVACFRCLMRFYGLALADLRIAQTDFPQVILDIERLELGISAGLQDRVIQTYGGLVHMDFSQVGNGNGKGVYTPLDASLLPNFYLAYNTSAGGESGKVHSTVKERWALRDPALVAGMQELGTCADCAVEALKALNYMELGALMARNFGLRRKLYGDEVVGPKNLKVIDIATSMGLASKFTGSGGAILCLRVDGLNEWYDADTESRCRSAFGAEGFEFIRISVPL